MSNHAYVKTKKKITPQDIDDLLDTANKTIFRNCLKIKKWKDTEKPTWSVEIVSKKNKQKFGGPVNFWLNNAKSLEIRHAELDVNWWFDLYLQNEVALQFDGIRTDDGTDSKQKPVAHKYDNIFLLTVDATPTKIKRFYFYPYYKGEVPPEFIDYIDKKHGFKTKKFLKEYKTYLNMIKKLNKFSAYSAEWNAARNEIIEKLNLNERI